MLPPLSLIAKVMLRSWSKWNLRVCNFAYSSYLYGRHKTDISSSYNYLQHQDSSFQNTKTCRVYQITGKFIFCANICSWLRFIYPVKYPKSPVFGKHWSMHHGFLERRSSHRRCSVKKGVLRNFAKFTGKHLCQSLFFNKVASLRLATLIKKSL